MWFAAGMRKRVRERDEQLVRLARLHVLVVLEYHGCNHYTPLDKLHQGIYTTSNR